jgi:glycine/D-amino acid oxidase-like deaminating enzyme
MNATTLPVAVIGAGPVGLAAAAHLHERGIPFIVFEVGDDIAASIRDWAHVQLFSPWSYDVDPAARRLLEAEGWSAPDSAEHPSGAELLQRDLEPLALLPAISVGLHTNRLVTAITPRRHRQDHHTRPQRGTVRRHHRRAARPRTHRCLSRDRRLRHLAHAQSARLRRTPGSR